MRCHDHRPNGRVIVVIAELFFVERLLFGLLLYGHGAEIRVQQDHPHAIGYVGIAGGYVVGKAFLKIALSLFWPPHHVMVTHDGLHVDVSFFAVGQKGIDHGPGGIFVAQHHNVAQPVEGFRVAVQDFAENSLRGFYVVALFQKQRLDPHRSLCIGEKSEERHSLQFTVCSIH